MEPLAAWPKKLQGSVAVPPATVRFPSQWSLPCQPRLLAKDKGNNEMKPGAMCIPPGIDLWLRQNPGKSRLGERLMTVIPNIVSRISQNVRKAEENNRSMCIRCF